MQALFSVCCFLMIITIFSIGVVVKHSRDKAPVCTVAAKVMKKHIQEICYTSGIAGDAAASRGMGIAPRVCYEIFFESEDCCNLWFHVSAETYCSVAEGMSGQLSYKGTQLLAFIPDAPEE